jgi:hypothetical protein
MKITKERLNKIIKEEIEAVLSEKDIISEIFGQGGFIDNLRGGGHKRAKERRDLAAEIKKLGTELYNSLPRRLPIPPEWNEKYRAFELGIGKVKSAHSTPEVKKDPRLVRQGEGHEESLNYTKLRIAKAIKNMLPQHKSELKFSEKDATELGILPTVVDMILDPTTSDRYFKVKHNPEKYSPDRINKPVKYENK